MEILVSNPRVVKVKTINVMAKVRDCGSYSLASDEGGIVHEHDGGVPGFFPGEHYGDYLDLKIDLETGTILNWITPSESALQEYVGELDE